ncbi:MAG: aryl-sulfate sulfotransferase [Myxococcota bacterium]
MPSAHPVRLTCTELGGDEERHVLQLPSATEHHTTVRGLKANTRYGCEVEALDAPHLRARASTLITAPLPFDLKTPELLVPNSNLAEMGYTLYNYGIYRGGFKNNYLVILDAKAQVRWYLPGPGAGDVDASYLGNDKILYGGMSAAYYPPTLVGLDKVTQWKGTTTPVATYENVGQVNHDAHLSADGKSIFLLNYATLDDYYLVYIVKQIDLATNTVIWSWDSIADGLEKGELPAGGSSSDLYHANSVFDQWEDGKLYVYVGMRNLHRVLKLDYTSKAVVWRLGVNGDFKLLEADGTPATSNARWFFHQHDAKFVRPGLFSVYDNGTARSSYGGSNYTRGLQLQLDERAMTAQIVFEYKETGWNEAFWGGYDVLENGNSLIAMGHFSNGTAGHNSALVQVNPAGSVVWRAEFKSDKDAVYRAERIDGCEIFSNTDYCPALADDLKP